MSRRRAAVKRDINPDAKFGDIVVAKLLHIKFLLKFALIVLKPLRFVGLLGLHVLVQRRQ